MAELIIPEQNIINAICVYVARSKQITPQEVEVELLYDDETGFSAEAFVNGQTEILHTPKLIEALRICLDEFLNIDPISAGIELILDDNEGIIAAIR
ncbi:DUF2653 family protein [Psychrobacillus sp.]|uniref:DUF2653 family protein n=1 Tax=Psychrobacillus sp. TaxID=1871623 RepID=UPI0028BEE862|nr:DUF2653 family protein [Psychrobacillus sp.]